ncbi:uncharacterized protein CANTADRAFT_8125 [Suhomyces tanzawaensis NRRL Y-17324]|uniref:LYC1 C-terminal domain-containing protein n=1 Tax=Suhomyces tanzawaensis NRRL Y-17324 TaxID=984487 RepID=A0A1E4SBU6_9ASCO|nr:uncharacterized protein CANTADRAFT_8125 [Suhomyces tanzawaensis NRRL Y-17324]ODV76948.1 hypothetical protein CANTADRAFT_8125 [Suhomyces tanzawaensis NRRL Y-17324]
MTISSQYELVEASDIDVINYTRSRNAVSWKGALSAEDYVLRERVLGKSRATTTTPHRLAVFVLRRKGTTEPLASCELFIRSAWRVDYVDSVPVKRQVLCGCVGGVFTYPENRKQGLGKIMIDQLVEHSKLSKYVGPDGYTFLYSEIGEYYTQFGFKSFAVPLTNISLDDKGDEHDLGNHELIYYHQFDEYYQYYSDQVQRNTLKQVEADKKSRVTIAPTSDYVNWFHLRSKYISYKLFYEHKEPSKMDFANATYEQILARFEDTEPKVYGIKLVDEAKEWYAAITWTLDFSGDTENYATVLKIIIKDGHDRDSNTIKLFKLMKQYLRSFDKIGNDFNQRTTKIVLWQSEVSELVLSFLVEKWGSKHGIDNSSRSAILMHNHEDEENLKQGKLLWEGNDKLPWF